MLDDLSFSDDLPVSNATAPVAAHRRHALHGFCPGSTVRTAFGDIAIEQLREGDMVWTRDDGFQPIRHIVCATLPGSPDSNPVQVDTGTLNARRAVGCAPHQDLLIEDPVLDLYLGTTSATAVANSLVNGATIRRGAKPFVHYIELRLKRAAVIAVDGLYAVARRHAPDTKTEPDADLPLPAVSYEDGLVLGAML